MLFLLRSFLALNLLIFWGYTLGYFITPAELATLGGITLTSPSAFADFRAIYGGINLGVGVIYLLGLLREEWRTPAVLLGITTAVGALAGRIISIVVDGPPELFIYVFMVLEASGVVFGTWLLWSNQGRSLFAAPSLRIRHATT